ncbi:MAG: 2-amino-4-hydroxy-6-hydroxymethyldihydropteridine diphosphokinase [Akkermansiaceae bacterium]
MANKVGIALGANLGNKLAQLQAARDFLRQLSFDNSLLQAAVYKSEPLDCPDGSPDFYNTVVEINVEGSPEDLLKETQRIEQRLGRDTIHEHNAPREIDLDILYCGDAEFYSKSLQIPHPEISKRNFVLQPLADIRPDLILPKQDLSVSELLSRLDGSLPPLIIAHSNW